MPQRYKVIQTPDQTAYVILDLMMGGWCALPDSKGPRPNLIPLEWKHQRAAQAWLEQCYRAWQAGRVPVPKCWEPWRDEMSPWAYEDERAGTPYFREWLT